MMPLLSKYFTNFMNTTTWLVVDYYAAGGAGELSRFSRKHGTYDAPTTQSTIKTFSKIQLQLLTGVRLGPFTPGPQGPEAPLGTPTPRQKAHGEWDNGCSAFVSDLSVSQRTCGCRLTSLPKQPLTNQRTFTWPHQNVRLCWVPQGGNRGLCDPENLELCPPAS